MTEGNRVVVIAMDGSADADKALDFYSSNLYRENDDIVILHCVHHRSVYTYESIWAPTDPGAISIAFEEESRKGNEVCKAIEQKLKDHNVTARVIKLEGGDPGHTVIHKSNDMNAAMIIMGSRGLGTIRRTLLGSVSDYIIHHSKCPVFVCRH
ncbi:universal stress protein YxiE-like [Mytilus californianus]|uniref:universal stress protein YxiE-like n=1 Tax=Mytilus californianus TaxID=6549 RepID=UPI002245E003|nr:universal stress protein YxiE-like [Mytilus californianus]